MPPSPPPRRRRWRRWLASFCLVLGAALLGAYLLRGPLFGSWLGGRVAQALTQQFGGRYSAGAVRGGWLADAVVVELRTERPPDRGPLAGLSWRRLEVTYGIVDLLRGRPLSGLHSLRIEGLALDLDFTRPPAEPSRPSTGRAKPSPLADLPARLPALELRGSLRARLPLAHGEVGTLSVGELALVSDGPDVDLRLAGIALPELGIAVERWSARITRDGPTAFTIASAQALAGIQLERLGIAAGSDGATVADLALGVGGGEAVIEARPDAFGARLSAIDCARLPAWLPRLVEPPTRGLIDGHVSLRPAADGWAIDALLDAREVAWRGFAARKLGFDGEWNGRDGRVRALTIDADELSATVRGLALERGGAWLSRAPDECTLDAPDCVGLLARLGIQPPAALRGRGAIALSLSTRGEGRHLEPVALALTGAGVDAHADGAADLPAEGGWRGIEATVAWRATLDAAAFPGLGAGWTGTVEGSGDAAGTLASPRGAFTLDGRHLRVAGREVGELSARGSCAWPRLSLDRLDITHPAGTVGFSGAVDVEARSARGARLEVDARDLAELTRAIPGLPALRGSARGTVTVDAYALGQPLAALRTADASAALSAEGLAVGARELGRCALDARLAGGTLTVARAELDGPLMLALAGAVDLGEGGAFAARVDRLELALAGSPTASARLLAPARASREPGRWRVGPAAFAAAGGRVDLALDLGDRLDAELRAVHVDPWALLPAWAPTIGGQLDASFAARGDPAAPAASLRLRAPELRVAGREASLALDLEQGAAGLRLSRCDALIAGALEATVAGELPATIGLAGPRALPGSPSLRARVFAAVAPGLLPERPGMPATGCAELRAAIDDAGARLDLAVRELVIVIPPAEEMRSAPESIAEADVHVAATREGWKATVAARDSGGLALAGEGSGRAALDTSRPWEFLATLRDDDLAGRVTLERLELERVAILLPQLIRLSGNATGELRVSGRPLMPRWDGELALDGVGLKARSDLPAVVDGHGRLRLEGTRVTVEELAARMGYAPVTVTGSADLSDFEPAFDLEIKGDNVLLARNQYLRLRSDCDLRVHGPLTAMEISGTMRITDALYSRPIELLSRLRPSGGHKVKQEGVKLFSIREGPLAAASFDVAIRGAESFHVRTNVFRGDCSLDFHLGGTGESPLPRGRAWTEDARLRMPFTTIRVSQATVLFQADNPYVPRLEGEGEAKLKGYDLRVHAAGELPDIEVTVDSDPPLSTSEGVMLLTTGLTGSEREDQNAGRTELTMVGKYFAKEVWHEFKGPGDPDKESGLLDLDRLDLSIGQRLSETGQDTVDAEYELGSRFYLHGERDIFDDYNIGLIWRLRRH